MANMFGMMKQMRDARRLQKELESQTFEAKNSDGTVVVVARGDMTIKSLKIDPKAIDPARPERLAQAITSAANSALDGAKRAAAANVQKLAGSLGSLKDMLGG